jgi:hypothetical protein
MARSVTNRAAKSLWSGSVASKIKWNLDEFERIRKAPLLEAKLVEMAEEWVGRLNAELHAAQAKRKQPVEDGYTFHLSQRGNRSRVHIVAFTARAQAHEARNQSILKLMRTSGHDVQEKAGQFKNPTKGFTAGRDARGDEIHTL